MKLRRSPFASVETLEAMLVAVGFHAPATVLHEVTMTYRGPCQWWDAARSQGPWAAAWRHIPGGRLPAAHKQAFALLEPLRAGDGTLTAPSPSPAPPPASLPTAS